MKKFKKPLLINVPQDDDKILKSPSRMVNKQSRQKCLLLFNENTISSSVNNEDDLLHQQDYKCPLNQSQQVITNNNNNNRLNRSKKFNIIEFEQFTLENNISCQGNNISNLKQDHNLGNTHKRQFSIEIPQEREERHEQMSIKFAFDLKSNESQRGKQSGMKQPPAPSNKTSQKKGVNPKFVFPIVTTNSHQQQHISYNTFQNPFNQKITTKKSLHNHQQQNRNINHHQLIIKQLNIQWREKMELMAKTFQKQRQEFYKQKSRLEKQIMIKDGQIEMLQKLITGRCSPPIEHNKLQKIRITNNNNNYGVNLSDSIKQSKQILSPSTSLVQNPLKSSNSPLYISDQKITAMQTILLEKDLQINTLLQRINQLNAGIEQRNTELQDIRTNLVKSQKMNQSLRNEIFIHEKKDQSEKLTRQFYKVRQSLIQVQKVTKTPKGAVVGRAKWLQDQQSLSKGKDIEREDYPFRGIDDLHKRLESLKMNRIELESRGRMKSEMNYSLTSKNKTKGTFDFKGKFYDREREFNLRGGGRGY